MGKMAGRGNEEKEAGEGGIPISTKQYHGKVIRIIIIVERNVKKTISFNTEGKEQILIFQSYQEYFFQVYL